MAAVATCRERQRLLDAYGRAAADLVQKGRALATVAASYEADLFQRSWESCETARRLCATIRHELTTHMQEHGCDLGLFGGPREP